MPFLPLRLLTRHQASCEIRIHCWGRSTISQALEAQPVAAPAARGVPCGFEGLGYAVFTQRLSEEAEKQGFVVPPHAPVPFAVSRAVPERSVGAEFEDPRTEPQSLILPHSNKAALSHAQGRRVAASEVLYHFTIGSERVSAPEMNAKGREIGQFVTLPQIDEIVVAMQVFHGNPLFLQHVIQETLLVKHGLKRAKRRAASQHFPVIAPMEGQQAGIDVVLNAHLSVFAVVNHAELPKVIPNRPHLAGDDHLGGIPGADK